jgi:hypothetical protein
MKTYAGVWRQFMVHSVIHPFVEKILELKGK